MWALLYLLYLQWDTLSTTSACHFCPILRDRVSFGWSSLSLQAWIIKRLSQVLWWSRNQIETPGTSRWKNRRTDTILWPLTIQLGWRLSVIAKDSGRTYHSVQFNTVSLLSAISVSGNVLQGELKWWKRTPDLKTYLEWLEQLSSNLGYMCVKVNFLHNDTEWSGQHLSCLSSLLK